MDLMLCYPELTLEAMDVSADRHVYGAQLPHFRAASCLLPYQFVTFQKHAEVVLYSSAMVGANLIKL